MVSFFKKTKQFYKFTDQSFLNLFFYDNWKKFPIRYNLLVGSSFEHPFLISHIYKANVLHFNGIRNPWEKENIFYSLWKKNFDKADLINLSNRLPAKKPEFKIIFFRYFLKINSERRKKNL